MRPVSGKAVRDPASGVKRWALWELPRWLVTYITFVVAVDVAMFGFAGWIGPGSVRDLALFAALLACNAATVELTKRAGENAGIVKDVHGVWELPIAILLPPLYALLAPILRLALVQWRIKRVPPYRRVFSSAVIGLSYVAASLTFHAIAGSPLTAMPVPGPDATAWVVAVVAAGTVQWMVNTTLVLPAIKGADPGAGLRGMIMNRESVRNDVGELCVATLVALAIASSPLTIVLAFPFVTLLQRSVRHAQLVNASRIDSKTGLLNAGTWEREAAAEVVRAARTRTPVALALVDIDHFKLINDTHGHLAGDQALKAIARTFHVLVRDYDLVGRFGGEEFALLLPHTGVRDARRIAERLRAHISAMPIDVNGDPDAPPVRLTVSIGVAATGVGGAPGLERHLTDLIAAADGALYFAKEAGRDQVKVVADTLGMTPGPLPPVPVAGS